MVIINNKDDFFNFLKVTGVRMQTPSVTNSSSTLLRDNTLQPPQVQPPQQPQNPSQTQNLGVNNNNSTQQLARAILVCRPNSHPFNVSLKN